MITMPLGFPNYEFGEEGEEFWVTMRGTKYIAATPRGALMKAVHDWFEHPTAGV